MKRKILNVIFIILLLLMIICLTGCTDNNIQETSGTEQDREIVSTQDNVIKKWETLTMENMQEKVGEHIKWFYAAYLGPTYGWNDIYEYKDVIGQVEIPGVDSNYVSNLDELVGVTSKKDIEDSLAKYVSRDKFSKLSESSHVVYSGHFLAKLTEYNGKVYWISDGVGGGYYMKNPRIVSSSNEITKIRIESYSALGDELDEVITLTFEYDMEEQKFLIIDWEVEQQY